MLTNHAAAYSSLCWCFTWAVLLYLALSLAKSHWTSRDYPSQWGGGPSVWQCSWQPVRHGWLHHASRKPSCLVNKEQVKGSVMDSCARSFCISLFNTRFAQIQLQTRGLLSDKTFSKILRPEGRLKVAVGTHLHKRSSAYQMEIHKPADCIIQ